MAFERGVRPGERITLVIGQTRRGFGPGYKIGIIVPQPDFCTYFEVGYCEPGQKTPAESERLPLQVRPAELARVRVFRKVYDNAVAVSVVPEDRWSNVADCATFEEFAVSRDATRFARNALGVWQATLDIQHGQTFELAARGRWPVAVTPLVGSTGRGYQLLFGDLHTHSAHSIDCKERERMERSPAELLRFGRDRACLDFAAITDHHEPWQGRPEKWLNHAEWATLQAAVAAEAVPGRFTAFAGIEWRDARGDSVVIFGQTVPLDLISHEEDDSITKLWVRLNGAGIDYITIPHFHNPGYLGTGEWPYPPAGQAVEPVQEIFSCHGRFDLAEPLDLAPPIIYQRRADRNGQYLLNSGVRYGLVCNSDGHKAHIGMDGLTALLVRDNSRAGILEALRARRCYGTTNARIRLLLLANGLLMGSELGPVTEITFELDVEGEAPLRTVDLIADGEVMRRWRPGVLHFEDTMKVSPAQGRVHYYYLHVIQEDQQMAWSSPVWTG